MPMMGRRLRQIIREELEIIEGILDATSGPGRPTPIDPDERAAARAQDIANAKRVADAGAKKLAPAISTKKPEIGKMTVPDLKKWVKDYGKNGEEEKKKASDPEQVKKAAAAVLNLSKRDAQGSKDMLDNLKDNPHLRNAVTSTPGMMDMQTAADMNLRAAGRDPKVAVSDSWRELGKLSSKYSLAESKLRDIVLEELAQLIHR